MSVHSPQAMPSHATTKQLRRPLHLYPINTRPLTDLKAILFILPLLWLCGLEQVAPPILLAWATIKLLLKGPKIRIPLVIVPFVLFLIWQIVPQVTLEGNRDWVVSGRNMVAYASALFILLILANDVNNLKDVYGLIYAIIGLSIITTVIGLLFILQLLPQQFEALIIGDLLPGFLKSSRFVQESIIIREIGRANATFGPLVYPRVSSLFLSPNNAAIGYTCLLYWQWHLITISRRIRRRLFQLIFALSLIVFLFTASRVALLAFAFTFILLYLLRYQFKFRLPVIMLPIMLAVLVTVVILLVSISNTFPQFINDLFLNVREGSIQSRFILYESTLVLWAERPLTGWGVSKPVAGITLAPVGTHNEFLGTLFRSGLIGLTLYLLVLLFIWLQIGLRIRQSLIANNITVQLLSITIAAVFFSINLMYFAYSFYWDFSVILLTWITIGLIFSKPLNPNSSASK